MLIIYESSRLVYNVRFPHMIMSKHIVHQGFCYIVFKYTGVVKKVSRAINGQNVFSYLCGFSFFAYPIFRALFESIAGFRPSTDSQKSCVYTRVLYKGIAENIENILHYLIP